MYLIAGLGNPGIKYEKTRHNAGEIIVSEMADKYGLKFKNYPKFQSYITEGKIGDVKVILALPLTYMNNSGLAVSRLANFYKIDFKNIIIVHDEIDLPLCKMRVSAFSSAGGHNGVGSIIKDLGTKDFIRLRIGIGNKISEERKLPAEKFVLHNFSKEELKLILSDKDKYIEAIETVVVKGYEMAMDKFN